MKLGGLVTLSIFNTRQKSDFSWENIIVISGAHGTEHTEYDENILPIAWKENTI